MDPEVSNQRGRDTADDVEPCGMTPNGDLPWPLSVKVLPDGVDEKSLPPPINSAAPGKSKLCQAKFNYKGNVKLLQWQGPRGGQALLDIVRQAYHVDEEKLIYLTNGVSNDVLDVDAPMSEGMEYHVRVEPEDSGVFNIVPCIVNMCTFRYATDEGKGV